MQIPKSYQRVISLPKVVLSRDFGGYGRKKINPDRSRKKKTKKNKLSDNRSLRNVNRICRSRTLASASRNKNLFSHLYLVMFSLRDEVTENGNERHEFFLNEI